MTLCLTMFLRFCEAVYPFAEGFIMVIEPLLPPVEMEGFELYEWFLA